jgi:membrane-bound lytic murein transglycosylase D
MQNVLKQEGVPQDLIYLAVAESGFQPQVVNTRTGAGGMWQFMTYTGPEYGLTRNGYFDYRFDPEKSTRAYARYMKVLYGMFGDWYLAMAAYDWGPGNIQRVVSRSGYADYWELYRRNLLPGETRAYVPQILAAVLMAKNPERYGLNRLPPSPPVIYDTVTVDGGISVPLAADLTGSSTQEIVALNPALLRLTTPRDVSFDLHLPPGTKDTFMTRVKDIPQEDRTSWRFHVAKSGETLDTIAAEFHVSAANIASYNEVTPNQPVEAGDELVIPVPVNGSSSGQQRYTVHRGDTLVTIADRFNVSVEQLREWNGSSAARLAPGRSIYVAEPVRLAPGARRGRGRGVTSHASSRSASHASASSSRKKKRR